MSVVTISRGSYSRGKEVAEALAEELGYKCISRDLIVESSAQFNIPEIKLIKALRDAPSVLERFNHGKERYISFFKASFFEAMAKGNVVYHGLAGHFFLQGITHALKVRINAKMADRVREEMKRESCSSSEALYNLRKDDEERRKWGLQLYGQDTWDSRLYDMVLCVDSLDVRDVVDILSTTIKKKKFQETEASNHEMQKRLLEAHILARLVPSSPKAQVTLLGDGRVEVFDAGGRLAKDSPELQVVKEQLKEEFQLDDIIFRQSSHPYKGHVNTFYNLDI